MSKAIVGYEFTGRATIQAVPARDLDLHEYEKFEKQIEAAEKASGLKLYRPITATFEETKNEEEK